jgi:hypothetical protein
MGMRIYSFWSVSILAVGLASISGCTKLSVSKQSESTASSGESGTQSNTSSGSPSPASASDLSGASDSSLDSCLVGTWMGNLDAPESYVARPTDSTTFRSDGTGAAVTDGAPPFEFTYTTSNGILTFYFSVEDKDEAPMRVALESEYLCDGDSFSRVSLKGGNVSTLVGVWQTQRDVKSSLEVKGSWVQVSAKSYIYTFSTDAESNFELQANTFSDGSTSADGVLDELSVSRVSGTWALGSGSFSYTAAPDPSVAVNFMVVGDRIGINPVQRSTE